MSPSSLLPAPDSALVRLTHGGLSVGVEMPLDNDWSAAGAMSRQQDGRLPGVPDMRRHAALARLADELGFRALWLRDVPLYDPGFGDAGQVFDTFPYLGYLAGITQNILLGTAAVVLPLREPLLTLKAAATVDRLSDGRLLLGIASGDRPVEYPIFGLDYPSRGEVFRTHVGLLRDWGRSVLPSGIEVLPRPRQPLPLLVAGRAQQTPEWLGQNVDGVLAYPGSPDDHAWRIKQWRAVAGPNKPYIVFIHLSLDRDPDAPMRRQRLGGAVGRHGLIAELKALRNVGVQHAVLHLRHSTWPINEILQEIATHILPEFHPTQGT